MEHIGGATAVKKSEHVLYKTTTKSKSLENEQSHIIV